MNIVVIVADTFRRDYLGCYGNIWISTPYIDRFANKSVIFDNAYISSFPTVPNRADLFTGRFTFIYFDWAPLPEEEIVISEILSQAGYVSMFITDTCYLVKDGYRFERGFNGWEWIRGQGNDRYVTDPVSIEYPCSPEKLREPESRLLQYLKNTSLRHGEQDCFVAQTMSKAAQWLERNYKHENFFLWVDTYDPHEPWDAPEWYVNLYDKGYQGEEVFYPKYGPADYLTARELEHMKALYAGEVTLVDRWVGMLLQKIEDLGLFNNTAIIFTSDHGFYLGEHNLIGKSIITPRFKGFVPLYEEIACIPLLVYLPDVKPSRCRALVQPVDITATILDLGGIKCQKIIDGKSLLPLLEDNTKSIRSFTVSSPSLIHGPIGGQRPTITDGKWLFIYAPPLSEFTGQEETRAVNGTSRAMSTKVVPGEIKHELYLLQDKKRENVFKMNKQVAKNLHDKFVQLLKKSGIKGKYLKWWSKF